MITPEQLYEYLNEQVSFVHPHPDLTNVILDGDINVVAFAEFLNKEAPPPKGSYAEAVEKERERLASNSECQPPK